MRPLILALALSGPIALPGIVPSAAPAEPAGPARRQVPAPTRPQPPKTAVDELFRTALTEVLKEPREAIVPRQGPVLVRKDAPHVSARVIPPQAERGVALVTAAELERLATGGGPDRFYYLTLQLLRMDGTQAVVAVTLLPAVPKGHVAMCCWTVERLYRRTATGWVFERLVGEGVI
jgi:hypothetical protein